MARVRWGWRLLVLLLAAAVQGCPAPALDDSEVTESVIIGAPPKIVFQALREIRNSPALSRKLIYYRGKVAVIKETLRQQPILGDVDCIWQETEQPFSRIDYTMISSSKLKEAHGSYILTPSADGKSTTLALVSCTEPGIKLPFADRLTRRASSKNADMHLKVIKATAESLVSGKVSPGSTTD